MHVVMTGAGNIAGGVLEAAFIPYQKSEIERIWGVRPVLSALFDQHTFLHWPNGDGPSKEEIGKIIAVKSDPTGYHALPGGVTYSDPFAPLAMAPDRNTTLMDLTAGDTLELLLEAARQGLPIVSINKVPFVHKDPKLSQQLVLYPWLRFGATAGGPLGFPQQMLRLAQAGYRINEVEGIFSGTNSRLLSDLTDAIHAPDRAGDADLVEIFVQVVRQLQRSGCTEPNAWDDLCGADVGVKVRNLGRIASLTELTPESKWRWTRTQEDQIRPIIPSPDHKIKTQDDLERHIRANGRELVKTIASLDPARKRMVYWARFGPEGYGVGPNIINHTHPFFNLQPGENAMRVQTDGGCLPFQWSGTGAGRPETAGEARAGMIELMRLRTTLPR